MAPHPTRPDHHRHPPAPTRRLRRDLQPPPTTPFAPTPRHPAHRLHHPPQSHPHRHPLTPLPRPTGPRQPRQHLTARRRPPPPHRHRTNPRPNPHPDAHRRPRRTRHHATTGEPSAPSPSTPTAATTAPAHQPAAPNDHQQPKIRTPNGIGPCRCLATSHGAGRRDSNPRPSPWQSYGIRPGRWLGSVEQAVVRRFVRPVRRVPSCPVAIVYRVKRVYQLIAAGRVGLVVYASVSPRSGATSARSQTSPQRSEVSAHGSSIMRSRHVRELHRALRRWLGRISTGTRTASGSPTPNSPPSHSTHTTSTANGTTPSTPNQTCREPLPNDGIAVGGCTSANSE